MPTEITIVKTTSEKVLDWIKFAFKALFILIIFTAFFGGLMLQDVAFPGDITKNYVGRYEQLKQYEVGSSDIAWIKIEGIIASQSFGMGPEIVNSNTILRMLDMAEKDEKIKAIVLEIESPGGTILDSDKIASKVASIKSIKPVYALAQNLAASGGYYIASQATAIYAYDSTITGSIGVIMSIPNLSGLTDKVGIKQIDITSGKFKAMGSPLKPMDEESKKIFQALVDEGYEKFVQVVSRGRSIDEEKVREIADGRIYSGSQGLELNLIDNLNGKDGLLSDIDKEYGDVNILLYGTQKSALEELLAPMGTLVGKVLNRFDYSSKLQLMYLLN